MDPYDEMDSETYNLYLELKKAGSKLWTEEYYKLSEYEDTTLCDEFIPITADNFDSILVSYVKRNALENLDLQRNHLNRVASGRNSEWEFRVDGSHSTQTIVSIQLDELTPEMSQVTIEFYPFGLLNVWSILVEFQSLIDAVKDYFNKLIEYVKEIYEPRIVAEEKELKTPTVARKDTGRPHYDEDVWAHNEYQKNPENRPAIYDEWRKIFLTVTEQRPPRNPKNAKRQFRRIINKDWLNEKRTKG